MSSVPAAVSVLSFVDDEGRPHGMTISSLVAVSYEPPSVLVCVGGGASSRPFLVDGRRICVNLLASNQADQSVGFAYGEGDPFETYDWEPAADGTPVLGGTAGYLMCVVEQVVEHHGTAVTLAAVTETVPRGHDMLVYREQQYFGGLVPVAPEVTGRW